MTARVSLPQTAWDTILRGAAASPDREICGLLVGRDLSVSEAHIAPNRHPDPGNGFAICDTFHVRLGRAARARGERIVGCFHSHPSGDTSPSQTDLLAANEDGFLWLICAPDGGMRAWRARVRNSVKAFEALELAPADEVGHCAAVAPALSFAPPLAPIV